MNQLIGYLSEGEQLKGELTIPKVVGGGGGDTPVIESLSVTPTTSQQTYNDSEVDGYKPVVVAAMPTGTEGTPTATKGAVSNHSVSVTPSVTNQAGYIEGGTKTGTAVTVSASELDSGTKSITANGNNQDVVGYASVDVAVPNSYSAADEGKVVSNGALVAQTAHADVTPTTSDQTIDTTTNNSIKVKGDADLVAANIKKDVEIFGVKGSYEGGGGGGGDFFDMSEPSGSVSSNVTSIPQYVVNGRTGITSISLPNLIVIPGNSFSGCTSVQKIDVGNAEIGSSFQGAFNGCSSLQGFVLKEQAQSKSRTLYNNCFNGCSNLEYIDMCVAGTSQNDVFKNCAKLDVIVFRKTSVTTLGNVAHFNGTPFASGGTGGTLYVPSDLVSSYQSASNWSTILGYANNQIKSIESTHTDPTAPIDLTLYYADGTLIA